MADSDSKKCINSCKMFAVSLDKVQETMYTESITGNLYAVTT